MENLFTDWPIGGLLFVKSIFDPTEGTNKKFLQM